MSGYNAFSWVRTTIGFIMGILTYGVIDCIINGSVAGLIFSCLGLICFTYIAFVTNRENDNYN